MVFFLYDSISAILYNINFVYLFYFSSDYIISIDEIVYFTLKFFVHMLINFKKKKKKPHGKHG